MRNDQAESKRPGHLFAYGTLKPLDDEAVTQGGWLADAVKGRLYDLGPYPAIVDLDHPDAGWISGFVRPIEEQELIQVLDPYEAVEEGLFSRRSCFTQKGCLVWVYVYNRPLPSHAQGPIPAWLPADPHFVPDLVGRPYSIRR